MITQRGGGWPLTMFLAHDDQQPFFGGTYFPREARYGLPAFKDLLVRVAQFYRERPAELRTQNEALMAAFAQLNSAPAAGEVQLDDTPLRAEPRAARARVRHQERWLWRRAEVPAAADVDAAAARLARDRERLRA